MEFSAVVPIKPFRKAIEKKLETVEFRKEDPFNSFLISFSAIAQESFLEAFPKFSGSVVIKIRKFCNAFLEVGIEEIATDDPVFECCSAIQHIIVNLPPNVIRFFLDKQSEIPSKKVTLMRISASKK